MDSVKKIQAFSTFVSGPRVDVNDEHSDSYLVEFYENHGSDWALVHSWFDLKPFHFYRYRRFFRCKWKISVWGWENDSPSLVYEHIYNETGKNVCLDFLHNNFQVQKAWTKKAIDFRDRTRCNLIIQSKFCERLSKEFYNSRITFVENYSDSDSLYARYSIKKQNIPATSENQNESELVFENHSLAFKSWYIPVDWIEISNEEIFDAIIGDA